MWQCDFKGVWEFDTPFEGQDEPQWYRIANSYINYIADPDMLLEHSEWCPF